MNELPRKPWWSQDWFFALLLLAATFLAYQPAWHGEPVFDDEDHLTSPELRSPGGLVRIWTEVGAVSQYYPFAHSVFWLEHRLWGDAMTGYHLVNILLHGLAALLFVRVLKRLELPGAWLAGAVFALHPVAVESVAWISELKNTLSTVFYLGATLAWLRFDATRRREGYVTALALFILGLLSKSVVASLPAALLVIFWWKRGRLSWRDDAQPLLPFFALGIAAGLFTAWVERTFIGAEGSAFELSFVERGLVAGRGLWFYLCKLIWPVDLTFIYPRWQVSQAAVRQYLFPAAALALLAVLWALRRRWRGPLAALLLFGGTLFPVLGFLNVYPFVYSYVADHYQYLASLGLLAAVAAVLARVLEGRGLWTRPAGNVLCAGLLALLAVLTWRQSRMYAGIETLWQTTLERNPACFVAHSNLCNYLFQTGRIDEAIAHGEKALALQPGFAEVHVNLGNALREKGRNDEALGHYRQAVGLRPDLAVARYNLGAALLSGGQADEAQAEFRKAVELAPDYVRARMALGGLLLGQGKADEAAAQAEKVLAPRPDEAEALHLLGQARQRQGRPDEAVAEFKAALALRPDFTRAATDLGNALLEKGRLDEAMQVFEAALKLRPDDAMLHNDLGNALLQRGREAEALARYERALELQPGLELAHYNLGFVLLNQGKPEAALARFERATQIRPDYVQAWYYAGNALLQLGRPAEAGVRFERALEHRPGEARILNDLGVALIQQGRAEDALARFQAALDAQPDFAEGQNNLGKILAQLGREAEAASHYRAALKLQPDNPDTLTNLAWLLATSPAPATRNGMQAIYLARRADQAAGGRDPLACRALAAAFAECGRFAEATATAGHALKLAETAGDAGLAQGLREQLELYRKGVPFHEARSDS